MSEYKKLDLIKSQRDLLLRAAKNALVAMSQPTSISMPTFLELQVIVDTVEAQREEE